MKNQTTFELDCIPSMHPMAPAKLLMRLAFNKCSLLKAHIYQANHLEFFFRPLESKFYYIEAEKKTEEPEETPPKKIIAEVKMKIAERLSEHLFSCSSSASRHDN